MMTKYKLDRFLTKNYIAFFCNENLPEELSKLNLFDMYYLPELGVLYDPEKRCSEENRLKLQMLAVVYYDNEDDLMALLRNYYGIKLPA